MKELQAKALVLLMVGFFMAQNLPPLTWFRSFEAAARHLSFTAAADEIGLTQSAVSQQIKALETRLNVILFKRLPRALTLTDEGRRLLPQVEAALQVLRQATERYELAQAPQVLTVAASVSVIDWLIIPHLSDFIQQEKDRSVRFLSTIWPDDFATPRADVEIRFGSERQVGQGAVPLAGAALIAVASPSLLAWAMDDDGTVQSVGQPVGQDLTGEAAWAAGQNWSTLPRIETVGTSAGWREYYAPGAGQGAPAPVNQTDGQKPPALLADSYGLALRLAVAGQGCALVPKSLAQDALQKGDIVQCGRQELAVSEGYFLAHSDHDPAAGRFANWLQGLIAEPTGL
ncbi:Gcv operon activator [Thalassovita autumnalis]|uniref:Gcv operon activator n=2 Tax=Thalassovita autumnalis TaxID=2072972 RepID=A0A0P1FMY3_9RHOB|nr:Gcv operon activator [Thalassovita autumnalis]CUH73157.1 Gcv operon activator [Thalassovita autumnalis]